MTGEPASAKVAPLGQSTMHLLVTHTAGAGASLLPQASHVAVTVIVASPFRRSRTFSIEVEAQGAGRDCEWDDEEVCSSFIDNLHSTICVYLLSIVSHMSGGRW